MRFSKYLISSESYDKNYGLLYNTKNGYFVRYSVKDFKNNDELLKYPDIVSFMQNKKFLYSDKECLDIVSLHNEAIASVGKMHLIIKVHNGCNLNCNYCYEKHFNKKMNKITCQSIVDSIQKYLLNKGIKQLIVSWFGGEPLLNIDSIEYISNRLVPFCELQNIEYISNVVTNGTLLNKENYKKLIKCNVSSFQITVDGKEERHDFYRKYTNGNGSYYDILNNLLCLKNSKDNISVVIRSNISSGSIIDFDDFKDQFMQKFADDKRFVFSFHPILDFERMVSEVSYLDILELNKKLIYEGYNIVSLKNKISILNKICYAIKENSFVIETDGRLSKCTANVQLTNIGDVSDLKKDCFSYKNILKNNYSYVKCLDCNKITFCMGGDCPLNNYVNKAAMCPDYIGYEEELLKLMNEQNLYDITLRLE